jgi:hypothetical protein
LISWLSAEAVQAVMAMAVVLVVMAVVVLVAESKQQFIYPLIKLSLLAQVALVAHTTQTLAEQWVVTLE